PQTGRPGPGRRERQEAEGPPPRSPAGRQRERLPRRPSPVGRRRAPAACLFLGAGQRPDDRGRRPGRANRTRTPVPEPEIHGESAMNLIDSLKRYTTVVADTGDFEAIAEYKPRDATTNPSLLFQAAQKPQYEPLVGAALRSASQVAGSEKERAEA